MLLLPAFLCGATHTWTGAASSLWSNNANWTGGTPAGDPDADLVFPSTTHLVSTNDIPGVTYVNSLAFDGSGYTINSLVGSSIALAGGIRNSLAGTNTIDVPIALYGGVTHVVNASDTANSNLVISGVISGPAPDGLYFIVSGTLNVTLSANNTYLGSTTVAHGLGGGSVTNLTVLGSQPNSNVSVDSRLSGTGTIGSLDATNAISPGTSVPGILTVAGNAVFHDNGNLRVRLNGTSPGSQYDRLEVQGSAQLFSGLTRLVIDLGFTPSVGDSFTILQAAGGVTGLFGGYASGETFSVGCLNFRIDYTPTAVVLTRVAGGGPPLENVVIETSGSRTVCQSTAGGTVTATDFGGCANTHQWGFRTTSGGAITAIAGETGTTYSIDGADFPGVGTFYLVETTTPSFGSPVTSNELTITVVSSPTAVASDSTTICLGSSTTLSGSGAAMCSWSPTEGLDDPSSCNPEASPSTTTTYSLTVSGASGCTSMNSAQVTVTVDAICRGPSRFYTLAPCRVIDTRSATGPYGGPSLAVGGERTFSFAEQCGIPSGARSLVLNVTATEPTQPGFLTLRPAGSPLPVASNLNFSAGQTRAEIATVTLNDAGELTVFYGGPAGGKVHVVIDVSGYYQ